MRHPGNAGSIVHSSQRIKTLGENPIHRLFDLFRRHIPTRLGDGFLLVLAHPYGSIREEHVVQIVVTAHRFRLPEKEKIADQGLFVFALLASSIRLYRLEGPEGDPRRGSHLEL